MTKMCFAGAEPGGSSVVVATGLTSSLPMMPSSQELGAETFFPGPNCTPADSPPRGVGERYIASTLLTNPDTGHITAPGPISSLTRKMLCPAPLSRPVPVVGFPSTAYHWRSTAVSGTPVLLQRKVAPKSAER